jgi:hypothetical protein
MLTKPLAELMKYFACATDFIKPATGFVKPATNFIKPAKGFLNPATDFVKPATSFVKPATDFVKPATDFVKPATGFVKPATGFVYFRKIRFRFILFISKIYILVYFIGTLFLHCFFRRFCMFFRHCPLILSGVVSQNFFLYGFLFLFVFLTKRRRLRHKSAYQ